VTSAWRTIEVQRVREGARIAAEDRAATEAPLEIRLHGQPFVITMRTPGADRDLAAGFLLSEQVVRSSDEIAAMAQADDESAIDVTLRGAAAQRLDARLAERRQVTTSSACGICGRQTADALKTDAAPLADDWTIAAAVVSSLPTCLRARQTVFDHTGGLHAAGVFALDGTLAESAEDVGRHNAVDKVVGRLVLDGKVPAGSSLFVSGRVSFEIVQKAAVAGVPLICAVSAPSDLAVRLADRLGVTLVGFLRGDTFNVYTHDGRVDLRDLLR
jgi:FdhD protein